MANLDRFCRQNLKFIIQWTKFSIQGNFLAVVIDYTLPGEKKLSNIDKVAMQEPTSSNQLPRTPSYSHTPVRRKPRSTTSKIRDSCHSCALSKVRCPKEKPTCARCKKRAIVCEYFVTKRPGRKRETRRVIEPSNEETGTANPITATNLLIRDDEPGTGLSTREQSSLALLDLSPSSAGPRNVSGTVEFSSYIDILADLTTPLEQSPSPRLSGISNDLDRNRTPPMDFLELGTLDSFSQEPYDIEGLFTSKGFDLGPSFGNFSVGNTLPSKSFFPNVEGQQAQITNRGENFTRGISESRSTCCCIIQALDIMSKLFIPDTPFSASISTSPSDAATISNNTTSYNVSQFSAQTLVTQNRHFIEAVDSILQCSLCVETGYLVTILSTIISKILERYTEAARQCPRHLIFEEYENNVGINRRNTTTKEHAAHFDTYHDDDSRRATARLILGELHRVQGLMNRLSLRQNTPREEIGPTGANPDSNFPIFSSSDGQKAASGVAFSATTLGEMKMDLRKSLTALSFGIIKMLRES